jgi:hypothetical protein
MLTQTITPLPTPPNAATDDSAAFSSKSDAFVAGLVAMGAEQNALAGQMNELATALNAAVSGGAFAIDYTFSTNTAAADPGAGTVRLNNATQNLATAMYLDVLSSDGADWTNAIDLFDDSTSTVKGHLVLRKADDGTKFIVFAVTALAAPAGYRTVTVSVVASSSANPFANGAAVTLGFVRTGDKGDTGPTGPTGPTTPGQVQAQTYTGFTTGGTSSAYTLTPSPAIGAYAARQSFSVTFHAACAASPTINVNGLGAIPLRKQLGDGSYVSVGVNDIPANHRCSVVLLDATQALVERLPANVGHRPGATITATGTLPANAAGTPVWISSAGATTQTLMAANSVSAGTRIDFMNVGAGVATVARGGADTIRVGNGTVTSLALAEGDTLSLVSDGISQWYALAGSAQLKHAGAFDADTSVAGWERLPSGILRQWGTWVSHATPGTAVAIVFPTTFTGVRHVSVSQNAATTSNAAAWYDSPTNSGVNLRGMWPGVGGTWEAIGT